MPLTRDFKEIVRARLIRSAGFRKAVLQEALDSLLAGDVDMGKALLRDYVVIGQLQRAARVSVQVRGRVA